MWKIHDDWGFQSIEISMNSKQVMLLTWSSIKKNQFSWSPVRKKFTRLKIYSKNKSKIRQTAAVPINILKATIGLYLAMAVPKQPDFFLLYWSQQATPDTSMLFWFDVYFTLLFLCIFYFRLTTKWILSYRKIRRVLLRGRKFEYLTLIHCIGLI